jgi:hypothetical protein
MPEYLKCNDITDFDDTAHLLIYHSLNGVYIKGIGKWIKLDARGNKSSVNARFSTETEQLAFSIRPEKGEQDGLIIYPKPDKLIISKIKKHRSRSVLWDDLPDELESVMPWSESLPDFCRQLYSEIW